MPTFAPNPSSLSAAIASNRQHTLARPVAVSGTGLHTGAAVTCHLQPAPAKTGRTFVRVDLEGQPAIAASLANAVPAQLSTLLQQGEAQVRTIEHLMAALAGCSVDNCRIELNGPEAPILDGSALPWIEAIAEAGIAAQEAERVQIAIAQPLTVWEGDAFVSGVPSPQTRYTYGIDFANCPIGEQWLSWVEGPEQFREEIAPARTFATEVQARQALELGLIKGGSLESAIVCNEREWLTPLRFSDEPVRHKLIDLLGDLSLAGVRWQGHFIAYKASHTLHGRFAQQLLADASRLTSRS
ncbi:UDP-3-O-acyl-N-acetylglucosamine deacetylase [Synechococcus sp. PCC 7336]|uniref:UDP-3-O-acyl-N-acetylglucosamine deacetylase n=1 Tax=Synechococcus sp. PCC 7336 TaxID=195250 RepID=UPI000687DC08|nr:UDP-3-O-acyl-N-acetylglucosamine deacetylase [Synechococcus sp. PCC 7336]